MDKKTHETLNPIKINTHTMVYINNTISTVAHYSIFVSLMASNDVRKEKKICKFSENDHFYSRSGQCPKVVFKLLLKFIIWSAVTRIKKSPLGSYYNHVI